MVSSVGSSEGQRVFLAQLVAIERIIASIGRRHVMAPDEQDDFGSWVKLRLIENDYAILRKYQGLSSLTTFLTVVITNLFRDYRIQKWGRWRPSVAARRLGDRAVVLETLLYRDGYGLAQALEVLRSRLGPEVDPGELTRIAAQLPPRARVAHADATELDEVPSATRTDDALLLAELEEEWEGAQNALRHAMAALGPEDQLILRLRYWDGVTIANIARALGLSQKPLYRRIEQLLVRLRMEIEARGVEREVIENFFSAALR